MASSQFKLKITAAQRVTSYQHFKSFTTHTAKSLQTNFHHYCPRPRVKRLNLAKFCDMCSQRPVLDTG